MSIRVKIPAALQDVTNGEGEIYGDGHNLKTLLSDLSRKYPGLAQAVFDDGGRLQDFINIFVNDENVQKMSGEFTHLEDGDEVMIVSAVETE